MTQLSLIDPMLNGRGAAVEQVHYATAIYTRDPIVEDLLDRVNWPGAGRRLCDPSCGDGAFLGAALRRLMDVAPDISPADLLQQIEGWEFHPGAAAEARERVSSALIGHGWGSAEAQMTAKSMIRCADFLSERRETHEIDVIIGNPPYLRYANVPAILQEEYRELLPAHSCGDLLHSFLHACNTTLASGGEVALVTSDRWLFNESTARLRADLGQRLFIDHLVRLDATTAFYRPKRRERGQPPRIHPVSVVLRTSPRDLCQPLSTAAIYPGDPAPAAAGHACLGDVAEVRLAPWLGTTGVFVVDDAVARTLPAGSTVPAVDAKDFVNGTPVIRKHALVTRRDDPPAGPVLAHLDRTLHLMCERGRRDPHWLPPELFADRFDLSQPRLLIPRIAKGLRVLRLPPGILPINHELTVVESGRMTLDELENALMSDDCQAWIDARAPALENGYRSITTRLLRQLPVPG